MVLRHHGSDVENVTNQKEECWGLGKWGRGFGRGSKKGVNVVCEGQGTKKCRMLVKGAKVLHKTKTITSGTGKYNE